MVIRARHGTLTVISRWNLLTGEAADLTFLITCSTILGTTILAHNVMTTAISPSSLSAPLIQSSRLPKVCGSAWCTYELLQVDRQYRTSMFKFYVVSYN